MKPIWLIIPLLYFLSCESNKELRNQYNTLIRKINIIYSDLDNTNNRLQDLKFDLAGIEINNKTRKLNKLLNKFMDHSEKYIESVSIITKKSDRSFYIKPKIEENIRRLYHKGATTADEYLDLSKKTIFEIQSPAPLQTILAAKDELKLCEEILDMWDEYYMFILYKDQWFRSYSTQKRDIIDSRELVNKQMQSIGFDEKIDISLKLNQIDRKIDSYKIRTDGMTSLNNQSKVDVMSSKLTLQSFIKIYGH